MAEVKDVKVKEKNPKLLALFRELQAEKAKIMEELAPARADYERLVNDPRLIECRRIIKAGNEKLGPIDSELSALARALGAKVLKAEEGRYATESK